MPWTRSRSDAMKTNPASTNTNPLHGAAGRASAPLAAALIALAGSIAPAAIVATGTPVFAEEPAGRGERPAGVLAPDEAAGGEGAQNAAGLAARADEAW